MITDSKSAKTPAADQRWVFVAGAAATMAAACLVRALSPATAHPKLLLVTLSQGIVLINTLGWHHFAGALTGVGASTGAAEGDGRTLPVSRPQEALFFVGLKSLALAAVVVWVTASGVPALVYLAFGAASQLGFAGLLLAVRRRKKRE